MDIEEIVTKLSSGLLNCAVVIYDVDGYSFGSKIEALCTACGAVYSRIFMVTSVQHGESKHAQTAQILLYRYEVLSRNSGTLTLSYSAP